MVHIYFIYLYIYTFLPLLPCYTIKKNMELKREFGGTPKYVREIYYKYIYIEREREREREIGRDRGREREGERERGER